MVFYILTMVWLDCAYISKISCIIKGRILTTPILFKKEVFWNTLSQISFQMFHIWHINYRSVEFEIRKTSKWLKWRKTLVEHLFLRPYFLFFLVRCRYRSMTYKYKSCSFMAENILSFTKKISEASFICFQNTDLNG